MESTEPCRAILPQAPRETGRGWPNVKRKTGAAARATRLASIVSLRFVAASLLLSTLFLSGCETGRFGDYYDTDAGLSREDYRTGLAAQPPEVPPEPPPIPELQSVISIPELVIPAAARRVTVAVTETTPFKDILIEMARQAQVDLELDPRIEGGIIFSAYQRPFQEVVQRIADLAGLRYRARDGVVRIELDDPYHVNYRVNYLSLVRRATSEVTTSASVLGGAEAGGGNASSSEVGSESEADFWAELEANITQIMTNAGRFRGLVAPPVAPPPTALTLDDLLAELVAREEAAPPEVPAAPAVPPAAPPAVPAISRLQPAFTEAADSFTVNRQAGIVSVFGTERQHREIDTYLRKLHAAVAAQVLIEGKILEVTLDEQFRYGIDWTSLFQGEQYGFFDAITATFSTPTLTSLTDTTDALTVNVTRGRFDTIIDLIETFGVVRTLSNLRITVMQNQTAVLKVAEQQVFFTLDIEAGATLEGGGTTQSAVESEINTVSIGVVMTVQPSINLETEQITLNLRPTITRVASTKIDPAVALEAARASRTDTGQITGFGLEDLVSKIPEISVKEIDSVVTMRSGQVVIMGGLMEDRIEIDETGLPLLSDIPWLGYLFRAKTEKIKKTELVILIRATIVPTIGPAVHPYDAELYRLFGQDHRPFKI